MIVGVTHDELHAIFNVYEKPKIVTKDAKFSFSAIYSKLALIVAYNNNRSRIEEFKLIQDNQLRRKLYSRIVQALYSPNTCVDEISTDISSLIPDKKNDKLVSALCESIILLSKQLRAGSVSDLSIASNISTIHSVKGETHRSTTLVLSSQLFKTYSNGKEDSWNNNFAEVLFPFLIGQRTNYHGKANEKYYKAALKLAYVALSRPKYLDIVAIPEGFLESDNKRALLRCGWIEAE